MGELVFANEGALRTVAGEASAHGVAPACRGALGDPGSRRRRNGAVDRERGGDHLARGGVGSANLLAAAPRSRSETGGVGSAGCRSTRVTVPTVARAARPRRRDGDSVLGLVSDRPLQRGEPSHEVADCAWVGIVCCTSRANGDRDVAHGHRASSVDPCPTLTPPGGGLPRKRRLSRSHWAAAFPVAEAFSRPGRERRTSSRGRRQPCRSRRWPPRTFGSRAMPPVVTHLIAFRSDIISLR